MDVQEMLGGGLLSAYPIGDAFLIKIKYFNANQGLNFLNKMVNIANATRPKICRSRP